jgi:uncharacterized membrane protein YeiB
MTSATPVTRGERIDTLDVIRGFALLGIFITNVPWFSTSFYAGMDGTIGFTIRATPSTRRLPGQRDR